MIVLASEPPMYVEREFWFSDDMVQPRDPSGIIMQRRSRSSPQVLKSTKRISSEQIRAARALLRWEQTQLADASLVSLPTIKRAETKPGPLQVQPRTAHALATALEAAGVEFISENGGGPGVRLRRPLPRDAESRERR
jgi:hypothetical protein